MGYSAKVPGFGKLDQAGARQSMSGDEGGGDMQPPDVPQQQPKKVPRGFAKNLKGRHSGGRGGKY
jgi:hypothetical protein